MASANLLTVTALYDSSLNFYPSGKQFTIQADSQVLGTKTLPTSQHIPGAVHYVPEAPLLVVKSVDFGDLYLNLTIGQYFALVAATYASAGASELTLTLTVPGDTPASSTITSPLLYNGVLNALFINGISIDIRTVTLVNSGTNGVLTLSGPLSNGDYASILYYIN